MQYFEDDFQRNLQLVGWVQDNMNGFDSFFRVHEVGGSFLVNVVKQIHIFESLDSGIGNDAFVFLYPGFSIFMNVIERKYWWCFFE